MTKSQYQLQQAQHAQLRATAYKLPPDVELSKTTSPDEDIKSGKLEAEKSDLPLSSAPLSEPSSLKRSTSLHRRESSSDRLKPEPLSPHVANSVDDFKPQQNGLVTLSRFVFYPPKPIKGSISSIFLCKAQMRLYMIFGKTDVI